jgi:hypothetical protein
MAGYGYIRDSKPNVINWADIGKQMSDAIDKEITGRQKRKDDINAKSAEFSSQLLDQPQGAYAEANRFMSDFSSQASQQALRDLQALKSGAISEQEYYQRRANLKTGTDLMFKAGNSFNKNYQASMDRINNGEASVLEADLKAQMEGYLNFAKSGSYINPLTGTVNVSILDENGNVSSKRGDFMDASELVRLSTESFDNFKLDATIKSISDNLGNITVRDSSGRETTLSSLDVEDREKFLKEAEDKGLVTAVDKEVDAIVGGVNSKAAASILADHSGENYSLTFDINNKDKNKIIYDPNGNVQLTEDQLKKAKNIFKEKLLNSFDRSIKERLPEKMTPSDRNRQNKLDSNVRLGEFVRDALAATDAASLSENLEVIQEFNPKITSIRKTGENSIVYSIVNDQGKVVKKTITLSDNIEKSVEKALQQLLGPKTNVSEIVKRIEFKKYKISDIEGLYAPEEIKEIKSIDDPTNAMFTISNQGSEKLRIVSEVIENITEVNEEKAKDIKQILLNQQFEGADVEVYQESVPGRGGQGGRGRNINRGFLIKIPTLNIEQRVPSTTENIQDVIKKILSDATELVKTANLQLETVEPKKLTPLSK